MTNSNIVRVTEAQKYDAIISLLKQIDEQCINLAFTDIPATLNADGSVKREGVTLYPEILVEFLQAKKEALSRKASAERKPTAAQQESESNKLLILDYLSNITEDNAKTATEINKAVPELAEFNNQKVSGLLRSLWNKGINPKVGKVSKDGKSYFYGI